MKQRRNPLALMFLCREITSFTRRYKPYVPLASALHFDSYCESKSLDVYSKNRTINELIKFDQLNYALKLFDEMPKRDVVTYNLLISGYRRNGLPYKAFLLYRDMVSQGVRESATTLSTVLSSCSDLGFYKEGMQIQCRVITLGFGCNLYIGSSLVGLYINTGLGVVALKLFDQLALRNLATWNLILLGFSVAGRSEELLGLYRRMKLDQIEPNGLTYCYLIRGCCTDRLVDEGKQLHCIVTKTGWVLWNLFVANALVDFYSACGDLMGAIKAYETIPEEDVISWNSVISVYADHDLSFDSLKLFSRMQFWGKRPSIRSLVGLLNLASRSKNIYLGKQIHCHALKSGFDIGSIYIQSALIDMYGKYGDIEGSVSIYGRLPEKTLQFCNSLMTSLLHCGMVKDVFEIFGLMIDKGTGFDEISLSTALKAISVSLTSLTTCRLLHSCAIKSGFESDIAVSCSLIDAYARYGHIELSRQVFEDLPSSNVFCSTSLINGYAWNGMGREGLQMLKHMIQKGLKPDKVTFLCLLTGCNHSGLVKEGKMIFDSMKNGYDIFPDQQHYSCVVDLLGRAGLLDEAEELLQQAPQKDDSVIWSSLLRSCRVHRNERLGRKAAKVLLDLEPEDPATYLQASNFYAEIGDFKASMQIREIAHAKNVTRKIGHSLIETNTRF